MRLEMHRAEGGGSWGDHGFPHAVQRLVIAREMVKESRAFLLAGVS